MNSNSVHGPPWLGDALISQKRAIGLYALLLHHSRRTQSPHWWSLKCWKPEVCLRSLIHTYIRAERRSTHWAWNRDSPTRGDKHRIHSMDSLSFSKEVFQAPGLFLCGQMGELKGCTHEIAFPNSIFLCFFLMTVLSKFTFIQFIHLNYITQWHFVYSELYNYHYIIFRKCL